MDQLNRLIKWKPFIVSHKHVFNTLELDFNFEILTKINKMPEGKKISLQQAFALFYDEIVNESEERFMEIYQMDVADYCTKEGYQIILDGTEYEYVGSLANVQC